MFLVLMFDCWRVRLIGALDVCLPFWSGHLNCRNYRQRSVMVDVLSLVEDYIKRDCVLVESLRICTILVNIRLF